MGDEEKMSGGVGTRQQGYLPDIRAKAGAANQRCILSTSDAGNSFGGGSLEAGA